MYSPNRNPTELYYGSHNEREALLRQEARNRRLMRRPLVALSTMLGVIVASVGLAAIVVGPGRTIDWVGTYLHPGLWILGELVVVTGLLMLKVWKAPTTEPSHSTGSIGIFGELTGMWSRRESQPSPRRENPSMRRVVGVVTVLFWGSASIMLVLVALSWVASGLRDAWAFNLSGGAAVGLAIVTSGLLFWLELRDTRRESRTLRRENRAVPVEDLGEWSPKAWLCATAFGLSFFLSWYLLPALFFA